MARIERLNPAQEPNWDRRFWLNLNKARQPSEEYDKSLALIQAETGCAVAGAPYVIRAILRTLDPFFDGNGDKRTRLAEVWLDEKRCAAASGLSEQDKAVLRGDIAAFGQWSSRPLPIRLPGPPRPGMPMRPVPGPAMPKPSSP